MTGITALRNGRVHVLTVDAGPAFTEGSAPSTARCRPPYAVVEHPAGTGRRAPVIPGERGSGRAIRPVEGGR